MAWTEQVEKRNHRSRTYADGGLRHWSGRMAALHYESVIDSGAHDTPIDCTPQRINNAQLDGWTVTANGWHYALGKPLTGALTGLDGAVGFGGRKGQNWVRFRLTRLGYLHWPTRAWQDVGGAPTYARTNLSSQVNTVDVGPLNEQLPIESVANWNGLWATPGGGSVSARWRVHGNALKEEITINQAAREWVTANRPPTTPANETWFGLVFRVDWSDIPRAYRAGVLQDVTNGDFADDGQPLELRDALDRLLAFMPIDDVYVPRVNRADAEARLPLRKRFWKDPDGNTYLLVGVLASDLAGLRPGPLMFDPTINEQVGTSADDAVQNKTVAGTTVITDSPMYVGDFAGRDLWAGYRFQTVNVPNAATLTSAVFTIKAAATYDGPAGLVVSAKAENVDDAAVFAAGTGSTISGRTATTGVTFDINNVTAESNYTVDLVSKFQTVVNRAGWAANNDMAVLLDGAGVPTNEWQEFYSYDGSASKAAKLDIVYTSGITGQANITLGALTTTATGALPIAGQASITLNPLTLSATGTLPIAGQAAITLAPLTLSATGQLPISGQAAITLDDLTLSATGQLPITGQAAITLDDLTLSATGELTTGAITGQANITFDDLTLSATGELGPLPPAPIPTRRGGGLTQRQWEIADAQNRAQDEDDIILMYSA